MINLIMTKDQMTMTLTKDHPQNHMIQIIDHLHTTVIYLFFWASMFLFPTRIVQIYFCCRSWAWAWAWARVLLSRSVCVFLSSERDFYCPKILNLFCYRSWWGAWGAWRSRSAVCCLQMECITLFHIYLVYVCVFSLQKRVNRIEFSPVWWNLRLFHSSSWYRFRRWQLCVEMWVLFSYQLCFVWIGCKKQRCLFYIAVYDQLTTTGGTCSNKIGSFPPTRVYHLLSTDSPDTPKPTPNPGGGGGEGGGAAAGGNVEGSVDQKNEGKWNIIGIVLVQFLVNI